jgi:hypothetical protein
MRTDVRCGNNFAKRLRTDVVVGKNIDKCGRFRALNSSESRYYNNS